MTLYTLYFTLYPQKSSASTPEASYALFRTAAGPFFADISEALYRLISADTVTADHHLFFWALLYDIDELQHFFWSRSQEPVRTALLGACICRYMAHSSSWGTRKLETRALELEEWAVRVLDTCPSETATRLLSLALTYASPEGKTASGASHTLLHVAWKEGMKSFVSHRHCQLGAC